MVFCNFNKQNSSRVFALLLFALYKTLWTVLAKCPKKSDLMRVESSKRRR